MVGTVPTFQRDELPTPDCFLHEEPIPVGGELDPHIGMPRLGVAHDIAGKPEPRGLWHCDGGAGGS